jgi:hypothetical protein
MTPGANPGSCPWSAKREKWARRIIALDWTVVWLFILYLVYCGFRKEFWGAMCCVLGVVLFTWNLLYAQSKLAEMLENKPRSTAEMTKWVQIQHRGQEMYLQHPFHCECGALVHFKDAKWYPNSVDRGGGRFSIVCPCGIGYFKLKP